MEISKAKGPLKIIHPIGGERLIASFLKVEKGFYFLDIGYPEMTLNPFHYVEGDITGEGPWKIGDIAIQEIDDQDPLMAEWQRWQEYLKEAHLTDQDGQVEIEERMND